jgi:hypothetical protein
MRIKANYTSVTAPKPSMATFGRLDGTLSLSLAMGSAGRLDVSEDSNLGDNNN